MAALFRGIYEHQLDDKNRLRIPAKFKKGLTGEHGEKTYSFTRWHNGCIYVFPTTFSTKRWKSFPRKNSAKPPRRPSCFSVRFSRRKRTDREG